MFFQLLSPFHLFVCSFGFGNYSSGYIMCIKCFFFFKTETYEYSRLLIWCIYSDSVSHLLFSGFSRLKSLFPTSTSILLDAMGLGWITWKNLFCHFFWCHSMYLILLSHKKCHLRVGWPNLMSVWFCSGKAMWLVFSYLFCFCIFSRSKSWFGSKMLVYILLWGMFSFQLMTD